MSYWSGSKVSGSSWVGSKQSDIRSTLRRVLAVQQFNTIRRPINVLFRAVLAHRRRRRRRIYKATVSQIHTKLQLIKLKRAGLPRKDRISIELATSWLWQLKQTQKHQTFGAQWLLLFCAVYKYSYLLTYLLTKYTCRSLQYAMLVA